MLKTWRQPAAIWAGVMWVGGAAVFVGSVVFGTFGPASASPSTQTVVANQGTGGSSAWKVDGSGVTQPVSGTVNIGNLPNPLSITGTVGATQSGPWSVTATQGGPWNVNVSPTATSVEGCAIPYVAIANNGCSISALAFDSVLEVAQVRLAVPAGDPVGYCYAESGNNQGSFVYIPVTKQGSDATNDYYIGSISPVAMPVSSGSAVFGTCVTGVNGDAMAGQFVFELSPVNS